MNKNKDVVGASCVKDNDGKIVVEEDKMMEVWRAHNDKISNEEFAWDRNGLVSPVCGPSERITAVEVGAAIEKMKQGKSAGPKGVVAEMLKAAGETGTLWMTNVCNAVVKDGKVLPEDWSKSWMVNVYKGKVDALLFIIVPEALSREFREGLPMELLYADDLVLIAEMQELLLEKVMKWKKVMEMKGLRVNAGMTKVMWFRVSKGQVEDSGIYPCGACRKRVGSNSILCVVSEVGS